MRPPFTSLTPSDPAREGEGVAASRRSTAASPRSSAGAVEPETRAREGATPVDVAPLDVVARRREATASGRAAAVIDAVVAIVAIVAAVSSDEGARCFARPSAAKAKSHLRLRWRETSFFHSRQRHPIDRYRRQFCQRCQRSLWPHVCAKSHVFEFSRGDREALRRARTDASHAARGAATPPDARELHDPRTTHVSARTSPPSATLRAGRRSTTAPLVDLQGARADVASQRCPLKSFEAPRPAPMAAAPPRRSRSAEDGSWTSRSARARSRSCGARGVVPARAPTTAKRRGALHGEVPPRHQRAPPTTGFADEASSSLRDEKGVTRETSRRRSE